jgi:putative ABC transport system permease protein
MLRTILAGLRARTARLVLSSVAIALGVAFVSGTMVLGDGLRESVTDEFSKSSRGVDVSVGVDWQNSDAEGLPDGIAERIRAVPGVAGADVRGYLRVALLGGEGKAKPAAVVPLAKTESLREFDVTQGRYPTSANEIAVDERTATTSKLSIGGQVELLNEQQEKRSFTVVGTYRQGTSIASLSGGDHVVLLPESLEQLDPGVLYDSVVVAGDGSVDQQALAAAITSAIGANGYTIETGAALVQQDLAFVEQNIGDITTVLLGFALIALVVSSMVIYNTFTILVAQRTRELALLRCVGAGRGQVFRSVIAEALAMGLFASVVGLFGGIGVSAALQWGLARSTGGEADVRIPLEPATVVAAFAVGVLVTLVAAVLPALRATRVPPIAALRSQLDSNDDVARTGRLRVAFALVLLVGGVALAVLGVGQKAELAMIVSGAGCMSVLVGVLVMGPLLVGPINRVLGVVPRALLGVPAKLASGNAGRNPRRTAATTSALLIGVTIVSTVTVLASSGKETANAQVDAQFPADYNVTSSLYEQPVPPELVTQLDGLPEVAEVSPTAYLPLELGDEQFAYVTAVEGDAIGGLVKPTIVAGKLDSLADDEVVLSESTAERSGLKIGDTYDVRHGGRSDGGTDPARQESLTVVAFYEGDAFYDGLVTLPTARALNPELERGYERVMVKLADGVDAAAGRAAVQRVTDPSPIAVLDSAAETKAQLSKQVDQLLAFMWALIGLAVVIALFGIANTLSLSVLERTRESALLRALGLTRGQLRLMLVVESILMALMGAAVGLVLGIGFSWVLTTALSSDSIPLTFAVPYGQIGAMLVGAVLAAILAAALPARRAARTSVVAGMAEA